MMNWLKRIVAPSPPAPLPQAGEGSHLRWFISSPTRGRGCPAGAREGTPQGRGRAHYRAIALLFACSLLWFAAAQAQSSDMQHCDLAFSNDLVLRDVPVARTQAEQSRGLSNRDDIGPGMLFAWPDARPVSFWMKDTFVPLSIGFFDASGVLFSIQDMAPQSLKTHPSVLPALHALELKQGDFQRFGLTLGTRLQIHCS